VGLFKIGRISSDTIQVLELYQQILGLEEPWRVEEMAMFV
jgi:hypothetical protein